MHTLLSPFLFPAKSAHTFPFGKFQLMEATNHRLTLVINPKLQKNRSCKGYLYFHPSVEYDWKMHWQRNMCREHLGIFSDMNRENDNSESCHVFFFRFFQLVVLVQRQVHFKGVFGCAYRRDASKFLWLEVTNASQIIHGTAFVTIGESCAATWNSCRRGGWSV